MNLLLKVKYETDHGLLTKMIGVHNVVYNWGLTDTQITILVYIMRYGYSREVLDMICKETDLKRSSLSTNLSYLRRGSVVGGKKIKPLLTITNKKFNTVLRPELEEILAMTKDTVQRVALIFTAEDGRETITKDK